MLLNNTLTSEVAPDACFALLLDLPLFGGCVPGGRVDPAGPDGAHAVHLTIRLGPMRFEYTGRAAITSRDAVARSAQIQVDMATSAGGERARATSLLRVSPRGDGSLIEIATDVSLQGRAASFGQGLVGDVARRLVDGAAGCVEAKLRTGTAAPLR